MCQRCGEGSIFELKSCNGYYSEKRLNLFSKNLSILPKARKGSKETQSKTE